MHSQKQQKTGTDQEVLVPAGSTKSRRVSVRAILVLVPVALGCAGYYLAEFTDLVRFSPLTVGEFVQHIALLSLAIVIVERTVEVFTSGWREKGKHQTAETRCVAFSMSVALGVIVATMGIRALGLFVDPGEFEDLRQGQRYFFHAIDIVLTTGLIAGGSGGFHQLTSLITAFLERTKENLVNGGPRKELTSGVSQE